MPDKVPVANLPENSEERIYCKVVQVYFDDEPILRFGYTTDARKLPHHSEILKAFLDELNIRHETLIGGIPAPKGKRYTVVGMGEVEIFRNSIAFYGKSGDYGYTIDDYHLCLVRKYLPGWMLYKRN